MNTEQRPPSDADRKGGTSMEFLVLAAVFVVWFVLQAWILPKFGVST
jgi:hypothetical protein